MLKNIPPILSPELLKVLCEMGHSDRPGVSARMRSCCGMMGCASRSCSMLS